MTVQDPAIDEVDGLAEVEPILSGGLTFELDMDEYKGLPVQDQKAVLKVMNLFVNNPEISVKEIKAELKKDKLNFSAEVEGYYKSIHSYYTESQNSAPNHIVDQEKYKEFSSIKDYLRAITLDAITSFIYKIDDSVAKLSDEQRYKAVRAVVQASSMKESITEAFEKIGLAKNGTIKVNVTEAQINICLAVPNQNKMLMKEKLSSLSAQISSINPAVKLEIAKIRSKELFFASSSYTELTLPNDAFAYQTLINAANAIAERNEGNELLRQGRSSSFSMSGGDVPDC